MQNKTSKYFKYAIGEIVLVVIGILIALQINNWNTLKNNSKLETNYIKNIERDLNRQLDAIETQMDFESEVAKNCEIALKPFTEKNTLKIDSTFVIALGYATGRRTFINPNPAYKELISSGNIVLLKNEEFKDKLINYYLELERIEKIIADNNSFYTDQIFTPLVLNKATQNQSGVWDMIFKNYPRQYKPTAKLTNANRKRLLSIIKKEFQNEKNELLFVNHLSARKTFAMAHVFFLLEFKARTKKLLVDLKKY